MWEKIYEIWEKKIKDKKMGNLEKNLGQVVEKWPDLCEKWEGYLECLMKYLRIWEGGQFDFGEKFRRPLWKVEKREILFWEKLSVVHVYDLVTFK